MTRLMDYKLFVTLLVNVVGLGLNIDAAVTRAISHADKVASFESGCVTKGNFPEQNLPSSRIRETGARTVDTDRLEVHSHAQPKLW